MNEARRFLNSLENSVLPDLVEDYSALTSSLLNTDQDSVKNLQTQIDKAMQELENGVSELKGYLSTMETEVGNMELVNIWD
jgi:vacuolar-type H+-ATPase subunit C/Vma6